MKSHHLAFTIAGTIVALTVVKAIADKYVPGLTPAGLVAKLPAPSTLAAK